MWHICEKILQITYLLLLSIVGSFSPPLGVALQHLKKRAAGARIVRGQVKSSVRVFECDDVRPHIKL